MQVVVVEEVTAMNGSHVLSVDGNEGVDLISKLQILFFCGPQLYIIDEILFHKEFPTILTQKVVLE